MARLSVIVPVYNAQRFLDECLDSLRNQDFDDFEVLCVDDGSTDGSRAIIESHANLDARFRLVSQENGGPSAARNAGIRGAGGDYITFLDSDDLMEPGALRCMAGHLESNAHDALVFGWNYFPAEDADGYVRAHADVRNAVYPAFCSALVLDEMTSPYLRIAVRRSALAASGVLFDENLRIGEDAQFLLSLYPHLENIKLTSDKLYRYRIPRSGSLMADNVRSDVDQIICDLDMSVSLFDSWNRAGLLEDHAATLMEWFTKAVLYTILRQPPETRRPFLALVKQLWTAYLSESRLRSLGVSKPTQAIVDAVLDADGEGNLAIGSLQLSYLLARWRMSAYGASDLADAIGRRLERSIG